MSAASRRDALLALLGDLPSCDAPLTARVVEAGEHDGYWLEKLELDLNGIEPVPAFFVRPLAAEGRLPTVVYHHAHGGKHALGKNELLDSHAGVLLDEPYARTLTRAGYAALCIDAWCFGQRNHTSEHDTFKAMLLRGQVLWGMMVFDALRAVDYLHTRDDVDTARIGTMGFSMGSLASWWLAALEPRIKACAEMCCLVDYATLVDAGKLSEHNFYCYVPGLLKHFNTADIVSLIAPRAHLACVGEQDPKAPLEGVDRIDAQLRDAYAQAGAPEDWQLMRFDCAHVETPAMRAAVMEFLKRQL
ncbi:MAG: dienelactone hydrolase family protein [Moraxellaceae bacterium]|nr:dienelactone hydrolase family protein [Moraxellaceae bacterium]